MLIITSKLIYYEVPFMEHFSQFIKIIKNIFVFVCGKACDYLSKYVTIVITVLIVVTCLDIFTLL